MSSDRALPAWLLPLLLLAAAGGGTAIVLVRPPWLTGAVLALLLGGGLAWIAASVFWPAAADRRCPDCGEEALERLDPATTVGLRCGACGRVDPDASGWFLAEEEGPLEELVLRRRRPSTHTGGR